jgi:hypothetical protein
MATLNPQTLAHQLAEQLLADASDPWERVTLIELAIGQLQLVHRDEAEKVVKLNQDKLTSGILQARAAAKGVSVEELKAELAPMLGKTVEAATDAELVGVVKYPRTATPDAEQEPAKGR